jgi:GTPase SAR1 family protein
MGTESTANETPLPIFSKDAETDESAIHQLLSPEYETLLSTIDELSTKKLSKDLKLPLPQIIVCGNQSSGKSSVIEAISGKSFPKSHGCCTTFPTRLILRRKPASFSVSIKGKALENVHNAENFEDIINRAKDLLLNQSIGNSKGRKKENSYFDDTLDIEVSQPDLLPLTLVDLPGIIEYNNDDQTPEDIRLVREIVRKEMEKKDSIILVVVSAKAEQQSFSVLQMIKDIDPEGNRTMGVITHPDAVKDNVLEDVFIKYAQNQKHKFKLGWHVVKNQDTGSKVHLGECTSSTRDAEERDFFSRGVWKDELEPDQLGISALRLRLSRLLEEKARSALPSVLRIVEEQLQITTWQLKKLGKERSTPAQQRVYLTAVSSSFRTLIEQATDATYKDGFFGQPTSNFDAKRLRTAVLNLNDQFAAVMRVKGHSKRLALFASFESDDLSKAMNSRYSISDPEYMTRENYIVKINEMEQLHRTLGPPGLPNYAIIPILFRDQSIKWSKIAETHVRRISSKVQECLEEITRYVATAETAEKIKRHVISIAVEQKHDMAIRKVRELLKPFQRNFISTLNHSFLDKIHRQQHRKEDLEEKTSTSERPAEPAPSQSLDYMLAYYEVRIQ